MSIALRGCSQDSKFGNNPGPLSASDHLEWRVTESEAVCKPYANGVIGSVRACMIVAMNPRHLGAGARPHSFKRSISPQGTSKDATRRRQGGSELLDRSRRSGSSLLKEVSV